MRKGVCWIIRPSSTSSEVSQRFGEGQLRSVQAVAAADTCGASKHARLGISIEAGEWQLRSDSEAFHIKSQAAGWWLRRLPPTNKLDVAPRSRQRRRRANGYGGDSTGGGYCWRSGWQPLVPPAAHAAAAHLLPRHDQPLQAPPDGRARCVRGWMDACSALQTPGSLAVCACSPALPAAFY